MPASEADSGRPLRASSRRSKARKRALDILFQAEPGPLVAYNVACSWALARDTEQALAWLDRAVEQGFRDAVPDIGVVRVADGVGDPAVLVRRRRKGSCMQSEKLSYPGIAGAVAGIVGLFGVYASWFEVSGPGGSLKLDGTEVYDVVGLSMALKPQQDLTLRITRAGGADSAPGRSDWPFVRLFPFSSSPPRQRTRMKRAFAAVFSM